MDRYMSTVGIDYKTKIIEVDGKMVRLEIWDTAGQERYRTLTASYYRGAMGILLLYDITCLASFNSLSNWYENIKDNAAEDVVVMLGGSKADQETQREVEQDRAVKFAEYHGMEHSNLCAKTNLNIDTAFKCIAEQMLRKKTASVVVENKPNIRVPPSKPAEKLWCSC
ncbi:ras-related protein Rab-10-like [Lineus longissimus]|uniref:ras-related protein Rab-10-like n=1 Tax=Lineus longissimus TaxID=88925 RepID=UPI00315D09E7